MNDKSYKNIPKRVLIVLKMDKKQTAVEWLIHNVVEDQIIKAKSISEWQKIFEQAKQMEKEQILECWITAHQSGRFEGKGIAEENWQTFEQYYNETYGEHK